MKAEEIEDDQGREYVFNDFTAGAYQEFDVIKINKFNTKQERVLGIDRYHIYNDLPKSKDKSKLKNNKLDFLGGLFSSSTKNPLRKMKDIRRCEILSSRMFFIEMEEEKNLKRILYEVKNVNVRNEIVAKIKYIMASDMTNN